MFEESTVIICFLQSHSSPLVTVRTGIGSKVNGRLCFLFFVFLNLLLKEMSIYSLFY